MLRIEQVKSYVTRVPKYDQHNASQTILSQVMDSLSFQPIDQHLFGRSDGNYHQGASNQRKSDGAA